MQLNLPQKTFKANKALSVFLAFQEGSFKVLNIHTLAAFYVVSVNHIAKLLFSTKLCFAFIACFSNRQKALLPLVHRSARVCACAHAHTTCI